MTESDLQVLDTSVLDALCASVGDDRDFVVDLVETYLADGDVQIQALATAGAAGDATAAVRPAHTLKSSSATVGAMRLAAAARGLEATTRAGQAPVADDIDALATELAAVSRALRTWTGGGAG